MENLASPPKSPTALDSEIFQDIGASKKMRLSRLKSTARNQSTQEEAGSHTSFTSLPIEIRAKIFDLVVGLDFPLSTNEFEMLCPGASCGITIDRKCSEIKQAIAHSCLPVFHTSRMFRTEALAAFVRVNTWDVQPSILLFPRSWSTPLTNSGVSIESRKGLRNFYMRLDLCSAGFDILSPNSVQPPPGLNRSDKLACRRWMSEARESQRSERQTEPSVCCDYFVRITEFVTAIAKATDNPRAVTIDIVIHHGAPPPNPKIDQCGLTLTITIKFVTGVPRHLADPGLGQADALRLVQQTFCQPLEHRRRFLAPLLRLANVQKITVRRSWSVRYGKTRVLRGSDSSILMTETVWRTIYLGHHVQFMTAFALLEALGKDFGNFTTTGLRQMGIQPHQVSEYEENTPWNEETVLVPPAPPGYLGREGASI